MYDIIGAYTEYLEQCQIINNRDRESQSEGRLSASSAGLCKRKLHYYDLGIPKDGSDPTSLRTMRIGTLFGFDFERGFLHKFKKDGMKNIKCYTEEYVKDDEMNLGGHFDILIVDETNPKEKLGYLYDVKTSNTFKYKKIFGKKIDDNPSVNYEYQLGTYAFLLEKEKKLCDKVVYMANAYLDKNDGSMQMREAPPAFKDMAKAWWQNYLDLKGDIENFPVGSMEEIKGGHSTSPVYKWECGKYCNYASVCDSPHIKIKRVSEKSVKYR
jgi:hypothetical protein